MILSGILQEGDIEQAIEMIKKKYEKTTNGGKWVENITKDVYKADILLNITGVDIKPYL